MSQGLKQKNTQATSAFSRADHGARVNLESENVHGGYFGSTERANEFIALGINTIQKELPPSLHYVDFGGGMGFLTSLVVGHLKQGGYQVDGTVVDANPIFLKKAQSRGLKTEHCNLELCELHGVDLATLRVVLQYNPRGVQREILKRIYASLNSGGFLVNQFSSGSSESVALRNQIINHPLLLPDGSGDVHHEYLTEPDYFTLVSSIGFQENRKMGYAGEGRTKPIELWNRFNLPALNDAEMRGDRAEVNKLLDRKEKYLAETSLLFETACSAAQKNQRENELNISKDEDGYYQIAVTYPIVVSRR